MNFWQEILSRPRDVYAKLSRGQRVGVMALASLGLVVAVLSSLLGGRESFVLLYGGLEPAAASEVIAKLNELGVPYQLSADGSMVQVPDARVAEAKMQLAGAGLPTLGSRGFELFDGNQLGITDSLFQVNLQRALQGEIEKSIAECPPVRAAKVMVHLQAPGVYSRDKARASASVILHLRQGLPLTPDQVAAIAHLVAAGVGYGMRAEDVKISDSNYNLLFPRADGSDPMGTLANLQKEQAVGHALQEAAESQLRAAFGEGKASVRVSVELDTSYREKTSERVDDKNKVPVRSSKTVEGGDATASGAKSRGDRPLVTEQQDEFREGIERALEIDAGADIKRLSVSLLVDESIFAPGADGKPATVKESDLEQLVKEAVGFIDGKARKDTFKMVKVPFVKPPAPEAMAGPFAFENLLPLAGNLAEAVTVLVVLLTLVHFVRGGKAKAKPKLLLPPGVSAAAAAKAAKHAVAHGEEPVDELQELVMGEARGVDARTRLARFVHHHPEQARDVLMAWLKEEAAA
jgi:flagellar M-ring protein FliF